MAVQEQLLCHKSGIFSTRGSGKHELAGLTQNDMSCNRTQGKHSFRCAQSKNEGETHLGEGFRRITGKAFFRAWLNAGGNFRLKHICRKLRSDGAVASYVPLIHWGAMRRRKHRMPYSHGNFGDVLASDLLEYQLDSCDILPMGGFRPGVIVACWTELLLPLDNNPKCCIFRKAESNDLGINDPKTFRSQKQNIHKPGIGLGGCDLLI